MPNGFLTDRYAQEIFLDVDTGGVAASVAIQADGATVQTISVTSTSTDRERNVTLNPQLKGKRWRILPTPGVNGKFQLFSHAFKFIDADRGAVEHSFDWDDLGHPFDKRLSTLTVEYDTGGTSTTLNVDTMTGFNPPVTNTAALTFTLNAAAGRAKQTFAIPDGTIVKMVRVYPNADNSTFKMWRYFFDKIPYPADIVPFTEWDVYGSETSKYAQEIMLDVDTGGIAASVAIQADGSTVQTISVTGTSSDREHNFTLSPAIQGKKFRLLPSPGVNGKFQLFNHSFKFLPADKGPVMHSFDWDDLGHPFDKRLRTLTVEYDTGNVSTVLNVDTMSGFNPTAIATAAFTVILNAVGRSTQTFAVPDGTIVKMVRVYPATDNTAFKMWRYIFDQENYPADIIPWTDWNDYGTSTDKYAQELMLDIDTGGVAATVNIQADGATVQTVSPNTTSSSRQVNFTLTPQIRGKQFRLKLTPGGGGKAQLFKSEFKFLPADKGPVEHSFDWDDLKHPFDKKLKTMTVEYDTGGVSTVINIDTMTGFNPTVQNVAAFTFTLNAAAGRAKQTFAIPDGQIVKMVRVYPATDNTAFRMWGYLFDQDNYPADIVLFTAWDDYGTQTDKYAQELFLDVDTGGVAAAVSIQADGATLQGVYVTSTANDRERNITLLPQLVGKKWRIVAAPGTGGKFQLFASSFKFLPADKGPVEHSFDWDDLGHPFDKHLKTFTVEYDTGGSSTVLYLDTMTGFNPTVINVAAISLTLNAAAGRAKQTFAMPDGVIVKMVRVYPAGDNTSFRMWRYVFDKTDYPQDIIPWTEWDEYGSKTDKYAQELLLDVDTGGVPCAVIVQADGASVQTLSVTSTSTDRERNITISPALKGKRWRLLPAPGTGGKFQLFSHEFKFLPADKGPVQHSYDWDDISHPFDKHLKTLTVEYDTGGTSTVLNVDTMTGFNPTVINVGALAFTLNAAGRSTQTFAIPDGTIVKMVRVYPATDNTTFKMWRYIFAKENYPEDITPWTEWDDYGTKTEKYAQELLLDIDTGGVAATVSVQADGATVQMLSVSSTFNDRERNFTLTPQIKGKKFRLRLIPGSGGKTQLFSHELKMLPADKGPVEHSFDWDDLGHPFDKRLKTMTVEYDTGGTSTVLSIDTMTGFNPTVINAAALSFTLNAASGRAKQTFAVPDGTIAKMIRLYPATDNASFRMWRYVFDKTDYPADIVPFTEWDDYGLKTDKYAQELLLDVDTGGVACSLAIQADGATVQTVSVASTASDRERNVTLGPQLKGKRWRLLPTPGTGGKFQLFSHEIKFLQADKGAVSHSYDWDDLGHPYDKRLSTLMVEYDTGGVSTVLNIDTMTGFNPTAQHTAAMTFTLNAAGRSIQNYQIPDGQIVKAVRLYPAADNTTFKMWRYIFMMEKYPEDIVPFTEWSDYGLKTDKYAQELMLDVDTGGVAASVAVQADGATVQTLSVTTTTANREANLTLSPQLKGKRWRILAAAGTGGKFQLFSHEFKFLPADKGPVEHSFDWDDLGYPYDKKLMDVTIEYDTGGTSTTVAMDILNGVNGQTQTLAYQTFVLSGAGRSKQTFPIADGTIATMVRFRPVTDNTAFKMWKYVFSKIDYPANLIPSTEWSDLGYPCEKILRSLTLDVDTGGVPASLDIQADGVTLQTVTVNTTAMDRSRIISLNSNLIGRRFRLVPTPGMGGKFQLFNHVFDSVQEPCPLTNWDSYEQNFGYDGQKFIRQCWVQYTCPGEIVVSIYRDGGQRFFSMTLPPHPFRDIEQYYLPSLANGVTNKSKIYRIVIGAKDPLKPFKFYSDGSRLEIRDLSGDARAAWRQIPLSQTMPLVK